MVVVVHCNVEVVADEQDLEKSNVVYCLTFPSGKKYIGLTTQILRERISAHCSNKGFRWKFKELEDRLKAYESIPITSIRQRTTGVDISSAPVDIL